MKLLFVPLLLVTALNGQAIGIRMPVEHVEAPQGEAEPRRALSKTPLELYTELVAQPPGKIRQGAGELLDTDNRNPDLRSPQDAQIRAIQLDDDPESEYIVVVHLEPFPATKVIITDRTNDGWNVVGDFEYWYLWERDQAEKTIELHPPYIVTRSTRGGSNVMETTAGVYRLWKGQLYRTFEMVEHLDTTRYGSRPVATTKLNARIAFRSERFSPWIALKVVTEETITHDEVEPDMAGSRQIIERTCLGYEWVPATFVFEATQRASRAVCVTDR